ncbi:MAG: aldo/keto reductase [Alphaproteobacteria bacterium]|nr:aldo/keto reductase [Alphaproteobacteria bacterium]
MNKRKLGRTGLEVAPIAFGGNVFGWTADEATSHRLLDGFVDAGFALVDTADVYSRWAPGNKGGESEAIIGSWLAKNPAKRDRIVLATKCGMEMAPDAKGLSRAHIVKSVDASLKRLNTDRIDLFQSHRDDKDTPQEETLGTYAELVKTGKLRHIGASNFEAPRLAEALALSKKNGWPRYETLQPHYNLCERALYEGPLEALCLAEGVSCIGYYSLASGFLSGKYRSEADLGKSKRGGGVKKYLTPRGLGILDAVEAAGRAHKATAAQVALAWLIQRKSVAAPIVSATGTAQLAEILAAATLTLDAASVAAIDRASAPAAA